jgi:hypothetical protein
MMNQYRESIQLLNTAIVKSKEKKIDNTFEDRLNLICQTPAVEALAIAINHLAESKKISRDQAASQIIDTVKELESVWTDYVLMEGIGNLKSFLRGANKPH